MNFNAVIFKSGDEKYVKEEDPELKSVDADALKQYMPDPIPFRKAEWKADLQQISGIGPWIEKRLNKIKIFSCQQLKEITPELEEKINTAIRYFPGRVVRDEWKFQAIRIADGTFAKLRGLKLDEHPGKIEIDGEKYEKKLVTLADETMQDGKIEFFEAEALLFLAERHDGINASEKKTLEYILNNDKKYKFEEEAALLLRRKLEQL